MMLHEGGQQSEGGYRDGGALVDARYGLGRHAPRRHDGGPRGQEEARDLDGLRHEAPAVVRQVEHDLGRALHLQPRHRLLHSTRHTLATTQRSTQQPRPTVYDAEPCVASSLEVCLRHPVPEWPDGRVGSAMIDGGGSATPMAEGGR